MRTGKIPSIHVNGNTWICFTAHMPFQYTFRHAGWTLTVDLSGMCTFFRPCKVARDGNSPSQYTVTGPIITDAYTHAFGP